MWQIPHISTAPRPVLGADSFDEEFKSLFKATLAKPFLVEVDGDDKLPSPVAADDLDSLFFSMYSQPIEIDYRRRRTCSMEEYEHRDLRLRRRTTVDDDDELDRTDDTVDDEIFMLEL
ncbi:hypothetical protein ACHHYP_07593 [Achlya hypogyna]|uniref:Uncharacterized protein n=1 Tax=Achlya hypogyna TaxID=1202772 RepID=A0A1V9ZLR5_ACHHY|nr:hypothetical protein ACHHYP_07593 [Achlya hypogyna]